MATKWYDMITVYGYEIIIPDDVNPANFIHTLNDLNGMIEEPFQIYCISTSVSSHWDPDDLDADAVTPVIGFIPQGDALECVRMHHELDNYLQDNPIFLGLSCTDTIRFRSGIECLPPADSDDESSSESSLSDLETE
jgi:hypothetical protein